MYRKIGLCTLIHMRAIICKDLYNINNSISFLIKSLRLSNCFLKLISFRKRKYIKIIFLLTYL